jgi:cysteine desulfurase
MNSVPADPRPIYLDYNATTPVDPAVADAMEPYLRDHFGNPSSTHAYGRTAHAAVDQARRQVADLLDADPEEIVFTSGGSEANNHALTGVVWPQLLGTGADGARCVLDRLGEKRGFLCRIRGLWQRSHPSIHLITSAIEHPATLQPCAFLKRLGCEVTLLPVDRHGVVDLEALRQALRRPTTLVSIMHSNNEVGTLQPIRDIAALAHAHGALVHTDAAQSVGKVPVNVRELDVDLLSVAGHKVYAPKGVGVLYVRKGLTLEPLLHGAGHESGRRASTENVPYLVALGTACAIARRSLPEASRRLRALRDRLWQQLRAGLGDDVVLNGHPDERLPNTLNVNFAGQTGSALLEALPGIAASTGSACHEGHVSLSPVLRAMGVPAELGRGAVRLSVGRFTTEAEVDQAAQWLLEQARVTAGHAV